MECGRDPQQPARSIAFQAIQVRRRQPLYACSVQPRHDSNLRERFLWLFRYATEKHYES